MGDVRNYTIRLIEQRTDAHVYRVRTHRAEVEITISKDGFIGVTDLPRPEYDADMLDRFEAENSGLVL